MESKYNSFNEWYKNDPKAYAAANKLGMVTNICEFFGWERQKNYDKNYWTYERCKEEALKYDMKERWKKSKSVSYHIARRNGWYHELSTHMIEGCKPRNYWTYELCKSEALKYEIKEQWKKGSPQSYQAAGRNGWYHELTTHMKNLTNPNGYWTKERCIEHAKQFNTVSEWLKANSTPCTNARLNGWYDECTTHMFRVQVPSNYWKNKEKCIEEALKYKRISDWAKNSSSSYNSARKNGWYDECISHMDKIRYKQSEWTLEMCKAKAINYKTKKQWESKSRSSYRAAKKNGWFDECTAHMVLSVYRKPKNYWTLELCKAEAIIYKTKSDWKSKSYSSYNFAQKNDWLTECTAHMVRFRNK